MPDTERVEFLRLSPSGGHLWGEILCPRPNCGKTMKPTVILFERPGPPDVLCPDHGNEGMTFVVIESDNPDVRGWFAMEASTAHIDGSEAT